MIGFEPQFGWGICIGLTAVVLAAAGLAARHVRRWLRSRELLQVLAFRVLAVVLLLALLLQPFHERRHPDRERFQVLVLADASASMKTRDCDGQSRLAVLQEAIAAHRQPASWLDRFGLLQQTRTCLFSEDVIPYYGQPFDALPGRTAVGDALRTALELPPSPPIGAVLLLSDGNSNCGAAVEEVAQRLQDRGIPVSCVGVGELGNTTDTAVRFMAERVSGVKGQPLTLRVAVRSSQSQAAPVELAVQVGNREIARRSVIVPGRDRDVTLDFGFTPEQAGFHTAAVRLRQAGTDANPANDVDYAAVQVTEPPRFRVLYLGASLHWEYKFLQLAAAGSEQISLAAVIRTGPGTFFINGLPTEDKTKPGYPRSVAELAPFDSIVVETRALADMPESLIGAIADFVANRGGGLLCYGPFAPVPPALRKLLPVTPTETKPIKAKRALDVSPSLVFDRDQSGTVTAPPGLVVPPGEPVWGGFQRKQSARPVIWLADAPDQAVMVAQAYGSGRVAYCGLENSWRWRLPNQPGAERHTAYWQALLSWLSSASKARLAAPCHGRKVDLGSPLELALDVMSAGFLPASDATVSATVTAPSGAVTTLALQATGEKAGRYNERFTPEEAGEYRVAYSVALPGETLVHEARFLARVTGGEQQNTLFQEKRLRDVARITGGDYWSWRELAGVTRIQVSGHVPYVTRQHRWTESIPFLVGLIVVLAADWYTRRRLGLK